MTDSGWITQRETRTAVVLLIGDRAYKLKKPVNTGFLDFTTRVSRLAACQREVELNRRLAPDVYLGVADVLGLDGNPCDHLVVMRRMPAERRLSTLVRNGKPLVAVIRRLARMIATFHTGADSGAAIAAEGSRDAVQARWQAGFDQVRTIAHQIVGAGPTSEIENSALAYLAGRKALFDKRIEDRRMVDGHGDLLAGDIFCLDDGPRVLDCVEFDDRLRWLDGLADAAFLAMDLERLGAPDLARQFLRDYLEFTGDTAPESLVHHYLAYRAFARVNVACLRHSRGDESAAAQAREYAAIAGQHARASQVRLILVGGLPGTGKSTLAAGLADHLGATLLTAAGLSPVDDAAYTYGELLRHAEVLLSLGESVVVDASWTNAAHRVLAAQVAGRAHSQVVALRCHAPEAAAAQRTRSRGDAEIADTDAWPDAFTVDTTRGAGESLADAIAMLT